jgi:hypothetical protein
MQRSTHDKPIGRRLVQCASGIKAVGMDESEGVTARPFLAPGYGVVTAVHFAGYIDGAASVRSFHARAAGAGRNRR